MAEESVGMHLFLTYMKIAIKCSLLSTHTQTGKNFCTGQLVSMNTDVTEVPLSQVIHLCILLLCMLVEVTFSRLLSPPSPRVCFFFSDVR